MIRQLLRETGHQGSGLHVPDADQIDIRLAYDEATEDIARGVSGEPGPDESVLVYGYATEETPELMPLPALLAHRLAARLTELRSSGAASWLLPRGRTRVSVVYAGGEPVAGDGVEVIARHTPYADYRDLWETVLEEVVLPVLGDTPLAADVGLRINPAGVCMVDGLLARCGVSGRTVASDTYGAFCTLPATGLSRQGTENIQRSGVLMARHLAKHVVAAGLARRCTVHLAYQAGRAEPEAVLVDSHGTGAVPEERIEHGIRAMFPLTPWGIFHHLDLGRQIYRKVAKFGYFGRAEPAFTWERPGSVAALSDATQPRGENSWIGGACHPAKGSRRREDSVLVDKMVALRFDPSTSQPARMRSRLSGNACSRRAAMATYHVTDTDGSTLFSFEHDGTPAEALAELERRLRLCDLMLGDALAAEMQVEVEAGLEPWARGEV